MKIAIVFVKLGNDLYSFSTNGIEMFPPPLFPADIPPASPLWQGTVLKQHLKGVLENLELLKAITNELDVISRKKQTHCNRLNGLEAQKSEADMVSDLDEQKVSEYPGYDLTSVGQDLSYLIEHKDINLLTHEYTTLEAGRAVQEIIKGLLAPLDAVVNQTCPWEESSAAVKVANKRLKIMRNRKRRKKKRQDTAEKLRKERERYEQADRDADEWRAREIAKDIARRKVDKMKEIAKIKVKEEKRRLESELELALIVERLQELRAIRIQKLKKQGHFLPEEDNKFLERVRAAVEEEERQAAAAADTSAATNAIATAEESRKGLETNACKEENGTIGQKRKDLSSDDGHSLSEDQDTTIVNDIQSHQEIKDNAQLNFIDSLPPEFYHYYHGSNVDMGTLIEVRRSWDAFLMPGGSRIPGHWVHPPPPANDVWASYLVQNKVRLQNASAETVAK